MAGLPELITTTLALLSVLIKYLLTHSLNIDLLNASVLINGDTEFLDSSVDKMSTTALENVTSV